MLYVGPRSGQRLILSWNSHGLDHILNVHEGPVSISKRGQTTVKRNILSNEPGYYEEDQFGIRHEALVHVSAAHEVFEV